MFSQCFTQEVIGCESYFECSASKVLEKKSCPKGYFFDYSSLKCTNPVEGKDSIESFNQVG